MSRFRTVLVIDDEAAVRFSLKSILSERFNVVAFADGREAITFATERSGEVYAAFVDYGMWPMDGSQVCSTLQSLDATISLIGFSANENAPFGCPLFAMLLKKNISIQHVLTLVANAVNHAEKLKQNGHRVIDALAK